MRPDPSRRIPGLVLLLLLAVASGCHLNRLGERVGPYTVLSCPDFQAPDTTISVDSTGASFEFADGSSVIFPAGAITGTASYRVTGGMTHSGSAQLAVTPIGGAPDSLRVPATLRIGYSRCPFASHLPDKPLMILKVDPLPVQPMGGKVNDAGKTVEAQVGHFTGYAIAI